MTVIVCSHQVDSSETAVLVEKDDMRDLQSVMAGAEVEKGIARDLQSVTTEARVKRDQRRI